MSYLSLFVVVAVLHSAMMFALAQTWAGVETASDMLHFTTLAMLFPAGWYVAFGDLTLPREAMVMVTLFNSAVWGVAAATLASCVRGKLGGPGLPQPR